LRQALNNCERLFGADSGSWGQRRLVNNL
jgi:hypothetical protein